MAFVQTNATYTLSTDDTDIRAGETGVEIDIVSDVDVSGLAQADFSITGGTITGFTITDAQNAVLTVTAGNAGTMTITLAENAGSPNNAETSQNFTVNAIATVAISLDDSNLETGGSTTAQVVFGEAVTGLTLADFSVNVGTVSNLQTVSNNAYRVTVTAPSSGSGTLTLTLRENAVDQLNAEETASLTYAEPTEAFTVSISGTTNIEQGQQTTLTATVTDSGGQTPIGTLSYAWTASRGSFVGNTNTHQVTYEADFTDSNDVDVDIDCTVTRAADNTPTISASSLTAMTALGITGQLVNMHITDSVATVSGQNTAIYDQAGTGALEAGSDTTLPTNINISRFRWNTQGTNTRMILNNNGSGNIGTYFNGNTTQSVYLIFQDGTYFEIDSTQFFSGSATAGRWDLTDSDAISRLNAWDGTENLLVGIADAGSIGINAGQGTGTATVTATATISDATFTITHTDTIYAGQTVDITIQSNIAITDFLVTDVSVTGATRNTLSHITGNTYHLNVTAGAGAGNIVISIAEDAVNPGNFAVSETFTRNANPTIDITFSDTELENDGTTTVTMDWSETPTGFTASDVMANVGTLSGFVQDGTDDTLFTATLTAPSSGSGTITITIAANSIDERNALTTATIDYAPPFSVQWAMIPTMTVGLAFNVQLNFGVAITGLGVSDIRLRRSDGTLYTPTASELTITQVAGTNNYTLAFDWDGVLTGSGTYLLRLLANAVTYNGQNYPTALLNSTNFTIDENFGVSATFTISTDDTDIRANETTDIQITSTIDVTNFVLGDITVTGATRNSLTQNAADDYTLNITAEDGAGTITVSIAENVVDETNAAASQDFTRNANPTATVMFGDSELETDGMTTVTVMWSESVDGFTDSDTSVDFGTLSGFMGTGASYTETLTAPSSGSGVIEYTIPANAVEQGNAEITASIAYAEPEPEPETQPSTEISDTYDENLGYNVLPEALGQLRRVNANGTITSLGNLWYEQRAYNVALTRALSFNDDLHITMGYGNPLELLRYNSLASQADNGVHLVYGNRLQYVVPTFNPTGSVYDALAELAIKVNATLVFDGNIIRLIHREEFTALTVGGTGTGTGNLSYDSANHTFAASGYLLIGKEVIGYTGRTQAAFTGITRGVLGTEIVNHPNNTRIVGVERIVEQSRLASEPDITQDTSRIYNVIADGQDFSEERDAASISEFGEKVYGLDLGLTRHENTWRQNVFQSYLEQLKDAKQLIDVSVLPPLDLEIGQVIGTRYGELIYGLRIIAITYTGEGMRVVGRTV